MMPYKPLLSLLLFASLIACSEQVPAPAVYLGLGAQAGEVTASTAILQTRLCTADSLVDGQLPGQSGWVKFVYQIKNATEPQSTPWLPAQASADYIVKQKIVDLRPGQTYQYRVEYGIDTTNTKTSPYQYFRTNPGATSTDSVSLVVVTGMNYHKFHYGNYRKNGGYQGADKALGYPALASILDLRPDYFVGTGDNVYFDHPNGREWQRKNTPDNPLDPGLFGGAEVEDEAGMRRKYHTQFVQPRFRELFAEVATYWEKDDHDYRFNDADPYQDLAIAHELGIKNFREQLPVVDPRDTRAVTYRTHRLNQDLQIWLLEGRDYRSANADPDGPEKTIWGTTQRAWLKETLLASDAAFKVIISPTPMVGPDDAYKSDNHVNPKGFRYEGEGFFAWAKEQGFLENGLYFVCGDRHWQYQAVHPSGFEEFSTGALVDNNSRAGRLAGDPKSTDPNTLIKQLYIQGTKEQATGGFLHLRLMRQGDQPQLDFTFYDEQGEVLHRVRKIDE